ncbi:MAG: alpha-glucosidase [Oscillospiraceae bacterium]|nr:alpha-glucosidase [Candidatus Ruminococcus equi]
MKKVKSLLAILLVLTMAFSLACCGAQNNKSTADESSNLKWWQKTIVYEAYPSSFKDTDGNGYGDLQGLISELDHLASLGVGAIWLTPVFASPMGDNGYDVADYYSINPLYGTMDDMDELIAKAKEKNIRIVMDLVFNHTSNESEWFKESSKSKDNEKSDWYIWRDAKEDGSAPNNWRSIFGGSAWTYSESRGQYYMHTFADFQPDVNWENPNVRKALIDVAKYWVDKGVGGFRLDAITYIKKPTDFSDGEPDGVDNMVAIHSMTANTDGILDFLHEFKENVQNGTDIFMVGEANGVPAEQLSSWVGNTGVFDMIFRFDLVNLQFVEGEVWSNTKEIKLSDIKRVLSEEQKLTADNGWCPVFLENHDQPRSINHFLSEDADPVEGAKALAMLLMTLRGTPFLFEGEEIGMTNVNRASIDEYNDISTLNQYKTALENGLSEDEALKCVQKLSRDNARSPMQWNQEEHAGFTTGKPWLPVNDNYKTVNVDVESKDEKSVLSWYKKLNDLRQKNEVLLDGKYTEILADSEEIFAYTRENGSQKATILINFTGKDVTYDKSLVDEKAQVTSSYGETQIGTLKPFEAVCFIK